MKIGDLTDEQLEIIASVNPAWVGFYFPKWMADRFPVWMQGYRTGRMMWHYPKRVTIPEYILKLLETK